MMRFAFACTATLCALSAACSLFVSLDELSQSGAGVDSGVGAIDASFESSNVVRTDAADATTRLEAAADASSDGDATGFESEPNLHPLGTFESVCGLPWDAFQGTLARSSLAHSGTGSCRVCATQATPDGSTFAADDNRAAGTAMLSGTYRASAWIRANEDGASTPVALVLRSATTSSILELRESAPINPDPQWQRVEVTLDISKPGGGLNVVLYSTKNAGTPSCFLMDDVAVQRIR
jgi:hypothetical protein